jgi:CRP-like cAMP-binding protein
MQLSSVSSGWVRGYGASAFQQVSLATVLFQQGAAAQSAIFLERGWVKLIHLESDGQEQIALCGRGALLGAANLLDGQPHSVTATAMEACQILSLPAPVFLNLLRTDPQFSWEVHRAQSRQINAHDLHTVQFKGFSARLRLEQLLWQLLCAQRRDGDAPTRGPGGWKLLAPLLRKDLAQMLSVTPAYLSRLLKEMEADGLLHRDKDWLIMTDPERLWRAPEIEALTVPHPGRLEEFLISEWILA